MRDHKNLPLLISTLTKGRHQNSAILSVVVATFYVGTSISKIFDFRIDSHGISSCQALEKLCLKSNHMELKLLSNGYKW
jgi:hypothetical protein